MAVPVPMVPEGQQYGRSRFSAPNNLAREARLINKLAWLRFPSLALEALEQSYFSIRRACSNKSESAAKSS
jgi:hypothetical protein